MIYYLDNWSVTQDPDLSIPPEMRMRCLLGTRQSDGKRVLTSPFVAATGRSITTRSGTIYFLGEVDPNYLCWMEANNIKYDVDNPIKIKL
jgi:hypothetical protein